MPPEDAPAPGTIAYRDGRYQVYDPPGGWRDYEPENGPLTVIEPEDL